MSINSVVSVLLLSFAVAGVAGADGEKEKKKPEKPKEGSTVDVKTEDTSVSVSKDGKVKVKAGEVEVGVDAAAVAGAVAAVAGSGRADESTTAIQIATNNQALEYDCENRDVTVKGSGNGITLRGRCKTISVDGTGNMVCTDSVVALVLQGTGNGVFWKDRIDGKAPTTKQSGTGNAIMQGVCPNLDADR